MYNGEEIFEPISIPTGRVMLDGDLAVPSGSRGIVLFAHGSGSSRFSSRNRFVARRIRENGIGTLLFDLLTREEEAVDMNTRHLRFDIPLLASRLVEAAKWVMANETTRGLEGGFFGASTGGGAALVAAAEPDIDVKAVVSRGGRPDLAGDALRLVRSPVLLIVGGEDDLVIKLNEIAYHRLRCEKDLEIIPGATHLFEEPGSLEIVADLAAEWFRDHLSPSYLYTDRVRVA